MASIIDKLKDRLRGRGRNDQPDFAELVDYLFNSPHIFDRFKSELRQMRDNLEETQVLHYLEKESLAYDSLRDILEKWHEKWKNKNTTLNQEHSYYLVNATATMILRELLDYISKGAKSYEEDRELIQHMRPIVEEVETERGANGG